MKKLIVTILIGLTLISLAIFAFARDIELRLAQSDIQATINETIQSQTYESFGVTITVNRADIAFTVDNRITVDVDFGADGFQQVAQASGQLTTGLRYDAPRIYLDDIQPFDMDFSWGEASDAEVSDLKHVARDFLKRQRDAMRDDVARQALDRLVEQNRSRLEDATARVTRGFFQTIPIYDLNRAGTKGSLVSLALKDVRFEAETAVITLSPRQALLKILGVVGILALIIAFFAMQFLPGYFIDRVAPSGKDDPQ